MPVNNEISNEKNISNLKKTCKDSEKFSAKKIKNVAKRVDKGFLRLYLCTKIQKNRKMAKETKKTDKPQPMMPLGKLNFILMAACMLLIVIGLCLMGGSANEGDTFNYEIFSSTRTTVGPMLALLGFVLMAPAILYRKK